MVTDALLYVGAALQLLVLAGVLARSRGEDRRTLWALLGAAPLALAGTYLVATTATDLSGSVWLRHVGWLLASSLLLVAVARVVAASAGLLGALVGANLVMGAAALVAGDPGALGADDPETVRLAALGVAVLGYAVLTGVLLGPLTRRAGDLVGATAQLVSVLRNLVVGLWALQLLALLVGPDGFGVVGGTAALALVVVVDLLTTGGVAALLLGRRDAVPDETGAAVA